MFKILFGYCIIKKIFILYCIENNLKVPIPNSFFAKKLHMFCGFAVLSVT